MNTTDQAPQPPPPPPAPLKTNWPLFFAILFAPAALTFLRVANHGRPMEDWLLPPLVLFGSMASGIGCAILGEPRTSKVSGARRVFRIVCWSAVLIGFSMMFCFVGCGMGSNA